jgi:DNA-binding CsgD family transcriptional regulator
MAVSIIGREEELAAVVGFLERIWGGPSALVLSGEPGIGKTILWEKGVEQAERELGRVLTCRGVEAEASLSFAGLSDLLGRVLEDAASTLAPPRRRALEVALLLVEPGEQPPDVHAIGLAVLDVLRLLVERGPLLVALDDAQWLDPASAGVLSIALRRLTDEPVGLLATLRKGQETAMGFELDHMFQDERRGRICLGPLSLGAVHSLLREQLGLELTRPELSRVQEATAGNPFFALELGRELVRTDTRPAAGRALRVPERLRDLLGGRLARLPGETLDVLLQAAALVRPTLEVIATAHGDRNRVLEALETAAHEGVVTLDEPVIRFAHPLLASICYEEAPVWKRRAVHQALAGAVSDVEERARHLALAADGPDFVVAAELEGAAERAAARGATATAAELAELAADLTPGDPELARRRRLRAAIFHRLSGNGKKAGVLLEQLLSLAPSGVERSDLLFELGTTFRSDRLTATALYDEALAEAEGDDARSARILASRSLQQLLALDIPGSLTDARAALDRAERASDMSLIAAASARVGHAELYAAELTPGLLERGAGIEDRLALRLPYYESPSFFFARRLTALGEIDRATAVLEACLADAETRGDEGTRVSALWYLAMFEWYGSRLQDALEHAHTAEELGELTQFSHARAWAARVSGVIQADLGLVAEARESFEKSLAFARASANESYVIYTLAGLGRLELALGDMDAAGGYLRDLPERMAAKGWHDPFLAVVPDAIETLVALGELERAGSYLDRYGRYAVRSASPLAISWQQRCHGLISAARGDFEAAFASFDRALAELDGRPHLLERARTLLCLGVARRQEQQKKASREVLEEALAVFEELGARPWAERAQGELSRISGRTPAPDELTETERRVAGLAARGRTNKEIAAELYMGVSTVEAHLSHVYRKLGVRRAGLAVRLAASRDGIAKPVDEAAQV